MITMNHAPTITNTDPNSSTNRSFETSTTTQYSGNLSYDGITENNTYIMGANSLTAGHTIYALNGVSVMDAEI